MKTGLILRKLRMEGKEFVTSEDLKELCSHLGIKYESAIRHLVPRGHLVRVFRGVFYVTSPDEALTKRHEYSHLELVSKGLKVKGVVDWYFGLYTALKLNNMTHEHYAIDYVVNNKIQRSKPMNIAGYSFRFVKVKPQLLGFGVVGGELRHSDPEKTILDFIYLWRYNGVPDQRIALSVKEWTNHVDEEKMKDYGRHYPKTVVKLLEGVLPRASAL
jgi:predicted transcriptional regulator of viral defense system